MTTSLIRQIIEKVIVTMPLIIPRTEGDIFTFKVWDGDMPLEQGEPPSLLRGFRVGLGRTLTPRCNSNRNTAFHRALLEISIGYPLHLINPNESSRAGIEAQIAEDVTDVVDALGRRRLAALSALGPVRALIPQETRRTQRTVIIPFDLEWGQDQT